MHTRTEDRDGAGCGADDDGGGDMVGGRGEEGDPHGGPYLEPNAGGSVKETRGGDEGGTGAKLGLGIGGC